jgi:hypothetical protein
MRIRRIIRWSAWLIAGLLVASSPAVAPAAGVVGSLTVAAAAGSPALTPSDLTGVAIIANPGFEKTVTQSLPPFTVPVVVTGQAAAVTNATLGQASVDTTLVLTNATAGALSLELTLRDGAGAVLSTTPLSLAAHATTVVLVSTLLP